MEREEEIRYLAYSIWEKEGYPDGRNIEHWLKAEAILQSKNDQQPPEQKVRPPQRKKVRPSRLAQIASQ